MDAVEFFKEAKRMCRVIDCEKCPFRGEECGLIGADNFEERIAAVEKWAEEHPPKTRQSEFLKMFPNALIHETIYICPQYVEEDFKCPRKLCRECRNNYWFAEVD